MIKIRSLIPPSMDSALYFWDKVEPQRINSKIFEQIELQLKMLIQIKQEFDLSESLTKAINISINKLDKVLTYNSPVDPSAYNDSSQINSNTMAGLIGLINGQLAELWVAAVVNDLADFDVLVKDLLSEEQKTYLSAIKPKHNKKSILQNVLNYEIDVVYNGGNKWVEVKNINSLRRGNRSETDLIERAKKISKVITAVNQWTIEQKIKSLRNKAENSSLSDSEILKKAKALVKDQLIKYQYAFLKTKINKETKSTLQSLDFETFESNPTH